MARRTSAASCQIGLDPENVMVCFKETAWENWVFGGGRLVRAIVPFVL
jgi:phenylpyruvate tautomerase PptA (4-oxalocrotonate tautomerase family)